MRSELCFPIYHVRWGRPTAQYTARHTQRQMQIYVHFPRVTHTRAAFTLDELRAPGQGVRTDKMHLVSKTHPNIFVVGFCGTEIFIQAMVNSHILRAFSSIWRQKGRLLHGNAGHCVVWANTWVKRRLNDAWLIELYRDMVLDAYSVGTGLTLWCAV